MHEHSLEPVADLVAMAENALARGDYEAAQAGLLRAMERDPLNAEHPAMLASILINIGQAQAAMIQARQAVALAPHSAEYQLDLGEIYEALRAREMARTAFIAATRLEPAQPRPWVALARLERENGEIQQAEMHARRACTVAPDNAAAHAELGKALQARGHIREAAIAFRLAVQAAPTQALFLYNLGAMLAEAGEVSEALTAVRQAVQWKPEQATWLALLSRVERAAGNEQAALQALNRACRLDPAQARAFSDLFDQTPEPSGGSESAAAAQPPELAESPLRRLEAAAAADGDAGAYHALSLGYIRVGRVQEALAAARKAEELRQHPESAR